MPRQKSTHVDSATAVGQRLRTARERAGLSQRQLAFPGCTAAYISRVEAGQRIPSLQLLRELGRRLDVSEDYLARGIESVPAEQRSAILVDAEVALRLDDFERADELYRRALDEASDDAQRAAALEGLGHAASRSGNPREAVELLTQALDRYGDEPWNHPTLAEALGRCHGTLGEPALAIRLFSQCRDHFRQRGDVVNEVRFTCVLGYALTDAGSFTEAEQVLAAGLEAGREIRDPLTRARLDYAQSRLKGAEGLVAEAARHAEAALETLRATENTYFTSLTYQLLAALYNDLDRNEEALELLEDGRPGMQASATPIQLAHYQIEEARARAALGEEERAAALAMEAAAQLGDAQPRDRGGAYVLLSEIYERLGESDRARELCELAIEFLHGKGPNRYLIAGYKRLAMLLKAEGRTEEALEVLEQALGVRERAGRPI